MTDEFVDVLVVGAGISGIGAGCHLQKLCPERSFAIVEARPSLGGTWDLFRYPGVRSDSDMHTLGYSFRPWTDPKAIADGPTILNYLRETAREHGLEPKIRFGQQVVRADWSSPDAQWTVELRRADGGGSARIRCGFLFMCSGYYDYAAGHQPDFPGRERFGGRLVHPQHWPADLDYAGKKIVVIGSGATAVTLVPALADKAAHVTMLQRSPTWMVARPSVDPVGMRLRRRLPLRLALQLTRWKNVLLGMYVFRLSRRNPQRMRQLLLGGVRHALGPEADIATHFTPRYNPWEQRLCLVPDGDFFRAINAGRASVVTDHIASLTETGIALRSGATLDADHRQRHRPPARHARPRGAVRRRRAGGAFAHGQLQGLDVQRRAEYGQYLRLHQCLMDAQGRPDRAVCVPAAQPHAQDRRAHLPAPGRPGHGAAAVGGFLIGLLRAGRRPAAQARLGQALEAQPELPERPGRHALRRGRRRGAAVHVRGALSATTLQALERSAARRNWSSRAASSASRRLFAALAAAYCTYSTSMASVQRCRLALCSASASWSFGCVSGCRSGNAGTVTPALRRMASFWSIVSMSVSSKHCSNPRAS
jgi:cation diffusion facilitator CzcD-associated flavoprotein CzcO